LPLTSGSTAFDFETSTTRRAPRARQLEGSFQQQASVARFERHSCSFALCALVCLCALGEATKKSMPPDYPI
jgi:hypothetical protein